jgi:hypothetical protein
MESPSLPITRGFSPSFFYFTGIWIQKFCPYQIDSGTDGTGQITSITATWTTSIWYSKLYCKTFMQEQHNNRALESESLDEMETSTMHSQTNR